ncbi:hypothetical protein GCM10023185_40580 [Hymenobacter saemangeumensis]|uniref:Uncharacterized protein n=1 Tax=Hymenobacter saemangeumensis TaxID=1084522 RepID=A0ABP8IR31_9BACT
MKKLILLGACLLAFTGCPAQTVGVAEPDIVVVRIDDGIGNTNTDITITRGENKTEYLTFKPSHGEKGLRVSGQAYYKLIYKLYQEGYVLQSTFTGLTGSSATLLFVKAK